MPGRVDIRPWSADDLPVLERNNTPEMTVHLGGPESREKLLDRHDRYQRGWREGTARIFTAWLGEERVRLAAQHGSRDTMYTYPNVTKGPSNGLCRRMGLELEGGQDFEYPKRHPIRADAWPFRPPPPKAAQFLPTCLSSRRRKSTSIRNSSSMSENLRRQRTGRAEGSPSARRNSASASAVLLSSSGLTLSFGAWIRLAGSSTPISKISADG
jgi:hypothetical protein